VGGPGSWGARHGPRSNGRDTIAPMNSRLIAISLVATAVSLSCGGQNTGDGPASKESFRWDPHAVQRAEETTEETVRLSAEQKKELVDAIVGSINANGGADAEEQKQIKEEAPDSRVRLVDLKGDGVPEVIAEATGNYFCGATGDCFFWVFGRVGDHYQNLLVAPGVNGFTVQATVTGGFHDLVLTRNESAAQVELLLYTFGEGGYHEKACYEALVARTVGSELVPLKEPVITPCGE